MERTKMENNNQKDKDILEALKLLLQTTEQLKAHIPFLSKNQEEFVKILESHGKAIESLMANLIGTKEEWEKRLQKLELLPTKISRVEETTKSHEHTLRTLEERLKKLEYDKIRRIARKITRNMPISDQDLKTIEEILTIYPDSVRILAIKSEVLGKLNRKKESLEFLEKAISEHHDSARLWYTKGVLLDDLDEAVKCLDRALELAKDDVILQHLILFSKAAKFAIAERFREALESSTKSVQKAPDCYYAWLQKGMILKELGQVLEALGCYETAIKLNDKSAGVWFEKGITLSALGPKYLDEALASFDKALELDPECATAAYFNKGRLFLEYNRFKEAVHALDEGLKIEDDSCAWCTRGTALNRLELNEEALKSFKKAIELGVPKDCCLIFANLQVVYSALGDSGKAFEILVDIVKDAKKVEKLDPEVRADVFNSYAYALYENTNRHKEAAEFARKAVEIKPESAFYWDTLGCNLQAMRHDEEALEVFQKALALKKEDSQITWTALAKLYERLGRSQEAKAAYEKAKIFEEKPKDFKKHE